MHLEYEEFLKITSACLMLFTVWEDQFEQFREILRDLAKKRGQEKIPLRVFPLPIFSSLSSSSTLTYVTQVNVDNKLLQDRITQIRKFRRQHDELKNVIAQVLPNTQYGKASTSGNEINAVKEINEAFLQVKEIDVLVISKGLLPLPQSFSSPWFSFFASLFYPVLTKNCRGC